MAASHFRDGDFGTLVSVMSPAQLMRKTIHYVACGVLPLTHAVPTRSMFHNLLIDEALDGIPQALSIDHDLQHPNSAGAARLRTERRPR